MMMVIAAAMTEASFDTAREKFSSRTFMTRMGRKLGSKNASSPEATNPMHSVIPL